MKKSEYKKILILRTIGNFLILSALFMLAKTFYQPAKEEVRYFLDRVSGKKYIVIDLKHPKPSITPAPTKGLLQKALNIQPVELIRPVDPQFSIVIPKIDANARIIAGVDPSNPAIYLSALQKGVAQAAGTAFPGEGGHIYLFAHSTDYFWNVGTYNAVFYLLGKLEKGDEINLFYKGQRYVYRMIDSTIVDPTQVQYLTRKTNREFLTLQTCWPPGTTLKRLLIFAVRISE